MSLHDESCEHIAQRIQAARHRWDLQDQGDDPRPTGGVVWSDVFHEIERYREAIELEATLKSDPRF